VKRKKDLVPAALLGLTPGLLLHGHAPAAAHGALALALGSLAQGVNSKRFFVIASQFRLKQFLASRNI
jgi:hypothetical protein